MRLGFPVVAAATAVAAVFVLAQAVQGVDGPDEPRIGPTIVLPVTSDADAAPTRSQARPDAEPRRAAGSATEPRTERRPPRTTGGSETVDPAAPGARTPLPSNLSRVTPPSASPEDVGTEPEAPERVPVPVCRVDDDSAQRWMDRWNRDGDRHDWRPDRDRDRNGNDRDRDRGDDHGDRSGPDGRSDHNQAGCRD